MKFFSRLILLFVSNIVALLVTVYFIKDFNMATDVKNLFSISLIFTLINIFVRPILKVILSPIIFLTFGLGIILVNAAALWILDYFSPALNISSLKALLLATLVISFINMIIHRSAQSWFKKQI